MNLTRWLSVILMLGLILALNSLTVQAEPYQPYHHPHGNAYGWDGSRHHDCDRGDWHSRRFSRGPEYPRYADRVYGGPPRVAYVTPVAPVMGIPFMQTQPYFSQPAPRGLSGSLQYNF